MDSLHVPVLLQEVVKGLNLKTDDNVIDGTVGGGGHADAILKHSSPDGKLLGIDRDEEAITRTRARLKRFGKRVTLVRGNYRDIDNLAEEHFPYPIHGILIDCGTSRDQLMDARRGFSFLADGPLDMRLGGEGDASTISARELVNKAPEAELARIIRKFGEERYAHAIAHSIVVSRAAHPLETTQEIVACIIAAIPHRARQENRRSKSSVHPATRAFQAIRIAVNNELDHLGVGLPKCASLLESRGRCVVISFHSLEDRMVKQIFRRLEREGKGRVITKKPITPDEGEVQNNPASRSAKLRIFEAI